MIGKNCLLFHISIIILIYHVYYYTLVAVMFDKVKLACDARHRAIVGSSPSDSPVFSITSHLFV